MSDLPMNPNSPLHGSSPSSSATITPDPEPVDVEREKSPEERVPTPFPIAQSATSIQLPAGILPMNLQPSTTQASTSQGSTSQLSTSQLSTSQLSRSQLSLSRLSPSQASRSPQSIGHPSQPSTSASSSNEIRQRPLTPNVHVQDPCPAVSGSSSAGSFPAVKHLIMRLREGRRMNEESPSHSIASGLYEFAHMMTPGLPLNEPPIDDNFEIVISAEERRQRKRQRNKKRVVVGFGIVGCIVVGQVIGHFISKAIKG